MIATAVALQPRRLIIAGIDMFSDPSGAYPGDDSTPNAYVLVHDADLERRFIMETLLKHPSVEDCRTSFVLDRVKATT